LHRTADLWGGDKRARMLVRAGADPNARDEVGRTPLHAASRINNPYLIRVLLDAGADPNARSWWCGTPLHEAASRDQSKVVRLLLDAGADVSVRDRHGETPLDAARKHGSEKVVALLEAHLRALLREAQQSEFDALMEMSR